MKFKSLLCFVSVFFGLFFNGAFGFIVPDEIPSLLSVIYSNIPIIKKGTDSRIGWGFRLGDRADFQVLVELGPQKYTQPLANEPDKTVSNKRNTLDDLATRLWIQRQEEKKRAEEKEKKKEEHSEKNEAGSWLENWSENVKTRDNPSKVKEILNLGKDEVKPGLGIGEIDAKSVIPEDEEYGENITEETKKNLV